MTESVTSGRAGVQAEIDRLVSNGPQHVDRSGQHVTPIKVEGDRGAMRVTVAPGEPAKVETLRAPTAGSTGDRIADDGQDIAAAASTLQSHLASLQSRLNATNGYDPRTGQPLMALPHGSRERANVERQLDGLRQTADHQSKVWAALKAQRAADSAVAAKRAEVERFVAGDPAKAAALRAELIRRDAADFAERLLGKK